MLLTTSNPVNLSPEGFGAALIAALVLRQRRRIPMGDPRIERALGEMLADLQKHAVDAYQKGDHEFAYSLLELVEELSPDPSTGAYDSFWAICRRLQPSPISVPNPLYPALEINLTPAHAGSGLAALAAPWRQIVQESADHLAGAL